MTGSGLTHRGDKSSNVLPKSADVWKPHSVPLPWRMSQTRRKLTGNADYDPSEAGIFHVRMIRGDVMFSYTKEELKEALQIVCSVTSRCEKAQLKFVEATSQHTLLKNRIKAMYISKSLMIDENVIDKYTKEELIEALRPVYSIISKCEKAQLKFAEGATNHTRFKNIIKAMSISKSLITDEICKRG